MVRSRSASVGLGLVVVAGLGSLLLSLAGCSSGDAVPRVAPSSPVSASASVSGSPADAKDSERAFVAGFFRAVGASTTTGDVSVFVDMASTDCQNCRTLAQNIEGAFESGGHVEGGAWRILDVRRAATTSTKGSIWAVDIKTSRERWFDGDGDLVKIVRPSVQRFGVLVSSTSDGLRLRDLRLRS